MDILWTMADVHICGTCQQRFLNIRLFLQHKEICTASRVSDICSSAATEGRKKLRRPVIKFIIKSFTAYIAMWRMFCRFTTALGIFRRKEFRFCSNHPWKFTGCRWHRDSRVVRRISAWRHLLKQPTEKWDKSRLFCHLKSFVIFIILRLLSFSLSLIWKVQYVFWMANWIMSFAELFVCSERSIATCLEKKFRCLYDGCSYSSAYQKDLDRHRLVHTGSYYRLLFSGIFIRLFSRTCSFYMKHNFKITFFTFYTLLYIIEYIFNDTIIIMINYLIYNIYNLFWRRKTLFVWHLRARLQPQG